MTLRSRILFILIFVFGITLAKAQNCQEYHKHFCRIPDFSFFYNGQSKSADFAVGQTSELHFIVYEGMDYYISVCGHKKYKKIRWKILEDNEERTLLFDNLKQNYIDTVKFSIKNTRRFILEVSIPEVPENGEKGDPTKRCVGVLIGSRLREESEFSFKE